MGCPRCLDDSDSGKCLTCHTEVDGEADTVASPLDDMVSHTEISKEDKVFVDGLIELWPMIRKSTRSDVMKKLGKKNPLVLAEFLHKFING